MSFCAAGGSVLERFYWHTFIIDTTVPILIL